MPLVCLSMWILICLCSLALLVKRYFSSAADLKFVFLLSVFLLSIFLPWFIYSDVLGRVLLNKECKTPVSEGTIKRRLSVSGLRWGVAASKKKKRPSIWPYFASKEVVWRLLLVLYWTELFWQYFYLLLVLFFIQQILKKLLFCLSGSKGSSDGVGTFRLPDLALDTTDAVSTERFSV